MFDKTQIEAILAKAQEVSKDPLRFAPYKDDPVGFARDVLGLRRLPHQPEEFFPNDCGLWTKQQDVLMACKDHQRVAVRSGHGVSKSHTMGVLIAWWHLARQGRVISTGPTREHIEDVLWPELHHLHDRSLVPLPGQLDRLDWKQDDYWYATGMTTDKSSAFQGRHHPWLAVVLDEAAGVEEPIHLEAGNCATGDNNLIVMVGNPTITSGSFYEAFQRPDLWFPVHISCLDHPNVITGQEIIPGAVSKRWVDQRRAEWGEQHPFWSSRVLGEFPLISEKGVIPLLWLQRALNEEKRLQAIGEANKLRTQLVAGLDIARYGDNKCVLTIRHGDAVLDIMSWGHTSTMETIGRLIVEQRKWKFATCGVDASGLGGPVCDRLFEQVLDFRVHAHNGGHRAFRKGYYTNRRSELWLHLRNRMEKQRLWLPPNHHEIPRLKKDLLAPEYRLTSGGRMQVESKEDMMDRGVASPDWADSLMLCFAVADDPDAELEIVKAAPNQDPQAIVPIPKSDDYDSQFASLPYGF